MNLQEKIEALEKEFNEKIEILKLEAQREDKFPQDGDRYWYIYSDGEVISSEWERFPSEEHMLEVGNIFKTKEEAEFAVEKLKVEAELRKFSKPFKEGIDNWIVTWNAHDSDFKTWSFVRTIHLGAICFESEEKAQQAIKSVGKERIKKYIFGVED